MDNRIQLTFLKPGLQTTIQDHGREAFRAFGVPQGGPMDLSSAKLANWLVGNPELNPMLEFTLVGPSIQLDGEGHISLTGAHFKTQLDHQPLQQNATVHIKGSHLLTVGRAEYGCRGYMAIAGSWQLKPWLNSCSTPTQLGKGITNDSTIAKGSRFSVYNNKKIPEKSVVTAHLINHPLEPIRVLPGPEYSQFSTRYIKEFLGCQFTVGNQSSRMGYRLDNLLSEYISPIEVISSGVVPGTVQVTHSGQLIILMADAQTTGGYPRIANVISADLDKLAQMKPGDNLRFRLASLKEAYEVL